MASLQASTTQTTDGQGSGSGVLSRSDSGVVHVVATAVSGTTPSMTVTIEESVNGTNWATLVASTAITATGVTRVPLPQPFASMIRAKWAITGTTPSFTFSVLVDGRGRY